MTSALAFATFLSIIGWLFASVVVQAGPQPGLAPGDVIRTVVGALQNRNSPAPNAGIFTVYQFASPANRANSGPYGNFLQLVRLPGFAPLFWGHADSYGPLTVAGDRAQQMVRFRLDGGRVVWFRFTISRQTGEQTQGRCAGCWMVDGVMPTSQEP